MSSGDLQVAELRQQNDPEAPGNGRAGRAGELAGPSVEVVGLMGCKEGNRPLLPYPRASLTASRLADTALQLPNSCEPEPP